MSAFLAHIDAPREALLSFSNEDGPDEIGKSLLKRCRDPSSAQLLGYWRTFVHVHEPGTFSDSSGHVLGHGYILWEQKGGVTFSWELPTLRTSLSDLLDRGQLDNFTVIEDADLVPPAWSAKLEHLPKGWVDSEVETFEGQGSTGFLETGDELYPVEGFEADENQHQTVAAWGSRSGTLTMLTLRVEGFADLELWPGAGEDEAALEGLKVLLTHLGH